MNKWLDSLEQLQKRMEKRIRARKRKAAKTMFGKAGNVQIKSGEMGVDGKAILHRTKRHIRIGKMHGALGSEAMEVYKNGQY